MNASHAGERLRNQCLSHAPVFATLSWTDLGHHVPALTVMGGERGVGFDMHAWGRLDHRTLEATSQPSSFFPLFFASFVLPPWPLGLAFLPGFWQPSEVYLLALLDYWDDVVSFCSMSLRTQAWPAIEFVSGKEGIRPRIAVIVSRYSCLRVLVFLEFVYWLFPNFAARGLSGGRGEMAMAVASSARLAFLRGAVCASTLYIRCCPFGPCTVAVLGAPSDNRWEVVETPLPVKTQGRTVDCLLNFVHRVLQWGGFQVSLRKVQLGRVQAPGRERSVKGSCARRSTPQQSV